MKPQPRLWRFWAVVGIFVILLCAGAHVVFSAFDADFQPAGVLDRETADILCRHTSEIQQKHLQDFPEQLLPPNTNRPFLLELLKAREQEGRDNALIYYTLACGKIPKNRDIRDVEVIQKIRREGWIQPQADKLLPYLETWKPALDLMRQAAETECRGIGITRGDSTPLPDSHGIKLCAEMLGVEGQRLESEGRWREAAENYLAALRTGRNLRSKGNFLVTHMAGLAIETDALRQIQQLILERNLPPSQLIHLLDALNRHEADSHDVVDALRMEFACLLVTWGSVFEGQGGCIVIPWKARQISSDSRAIYPLMKRLLSARGENIRREIEKELEPKLADCHFLIKQIAPHFKDAQQRHLQAQALLRETRAEAVTALQISGRNREIAFLEDRGD